MDFWVPTLISSAALVLMLQLRVAQEQLALAMSDTRGNRAVPNKASVLRVYWPVALCVLLALSSWIPYWMRPDDLPTWPEYKPYALFYGTSPGECHSVINGDRLLRYRDHYRLASACYVYDGVGDLQDIKTVEISKAYEIRAGAIEMKIPWDDNFLKTMMAPWHRDIMLAAAGEGAILAVQRGPRR
jgi:hypothetical protein